MNNLEIQQLILYSKTYYNRGWLPATAGNLSIFDPTSQKVWITASGIDKSQLTDENFIPISLDGKLNLQTHYKPSAETSIHLVVYKNLPSVRACLHVHTPSSCYLEFGTSSNLPHKLVPVPNLEILKAFGDFRENPNFNMDVIYNFGEVPKIAEVLDQILQRKNLDMPFVLVENHGITVWGKNVWDANKNLEATNFLLQVLCFRKNIV